MVDVIGWRLDDVVDLIRGGEGQVVGVLATLGTRDLDAQPEVVRVVFLVADPEHGLERCIADPERLGVDFLGSHLCSFLRWGGMWAPIIGDAVISNMVIGEIIPVTHGRGGPCAGSYVEPS